MAVRGLRRDWQAGELRILIAALVVAVGSVSAVGFFIDRLDRALSLQANELLAADLLFESSRPIAPALVARARAMDLATARMVRFRSVLVAGEDFQLTEVKAVTEGYPLRGELRLAKTAYGKAQHTRRVPARGTAWLDSRLASTLGVTLGDTLTLGEKRLRFAAVLAYEPDRGGELFNIAPRLMMHYDDVAATGLILPGSRVEFGLLLAGTDRAVARFRSAVEPRLADGDHFHGLSDARPGLRVTIDRARQFLGLAALASVLLAGAAIAVSARRWTARRLDTVAVMRCLGASQRLVVTTFGIELALLAVLASLAGCVLGFGAQQILVALLHNLLFTDLPWPSPAPALHGLATGLVTLAGFALPSVMRLKNVPPSRVLRRDLGDMPASATVAWAAALAALGALVVWQARDTTLAGYVLGGGLATVLVLGLAALAMIRLLGALRSRVGTTWRFGLANIRRRARASVMQVIAFGLGIMALLLLTLVREDLLAAWQHDLPVNAPNHFLINIQPGEVETLRAFLGERGLETAELYPMVRGRLRTINQRSVKASDYADDRARRLATREFNLSWAQRARPDNRIVTGAWWAAHGPVAAQFSVEQGIAETLGVALGDRLRFQVAGRTVEGTVSNIRRVEWDSFQVNFFVVAAPGMLESSPATYITSFFLPASRNTVLRDIAQRFPSVTILDVEALLSKARAIIEHAVSGIEYVFLFSVLAGVIVLFAAVQSTMDERLRETAIVRALGASRASIAMGMAAEFITLGMLAGVLAALAASGTGAILANQIFHLSYQGSPWLWLSGICAGGAGIGMAGMLGARAALANSPIATLRALS